jgi:hypothetical protein
VLSAVTHDKRIAPMKVAGSRRSKVAGSRRSKVEGWQSSRRSSWQSEVGSRSSSRAGSRRSAVGSQRSAVEGRRQSKVAGSRRSAVELAVGGRQPVTPVIALSKRNGGIPIRSTARSLLHGMRAVGAQDGLGMQRTRSNCRWPARSHQGSCGLVLRLISRLGWFTSMSGAEAGVSVPRRRR